MRKRFSINEEECNDLKSSSDSDQYTADNLDLLNLKISFSSDTASNKFITRKSKARLSKGRNCGNGNGDEYNNHTDKHIKNYKHRKGVAGDYSDELISQEAKQIKPLTIERQEDDRSVLLLYSNKLNDRKNLSSNIISEEFLLPPRHHQDRSNKKLLNKPANVIEHQKNDVMTVSESSSKRRLYIPKKNSIVQGNFPFKLTPSGNFKVNSQQVVFESEKLSVLVANPENTTIDITEDMSHKRETEPNRDVAMDQIMKNGFDSSLGSLLACKIPEVSQKRENESLEYEGKATNEILDPELNLSRLGYTSHDAIDWNDVVLPEKKNLYLELYSRITNFTNADCKVTIGSEEFKCHLIVLQCYSEVFHTYVAVKKVELTSDKCSAASFAFIYEWMITGDPSYKDLNRENVLDIFNAAKYLKIKDLIEQCWAFIDNTKVFNEDTAFLLYVDAKEKGLTEVKELMLPRIQKFFLMLVSSQDWLELDLEDVQKFLQSNYICINCEMEVFMAGVRWLKHDIENREQFKVAVFSCVRFGNIAPWQLVDIKRNPDNPDFRELAKDPEISKMIDDGLAYVIIKYWYGEENHDYHHWNSMLALKEPGVRNWSGTDKTYFTYREFLIFLDQYRRNQIMEKSQSRERKKKGLIDSIASPCTSTDKMQPNDEFLSSRKIAQNLPKKINSPTMRPHNALRQQRYKFVTLDQAARIIQRAYRRYKLRKKRKQFRMHSPKQQISPRRSRSPHYSPPEYERTSARERKGVPSPNRHMSQQHQQDTSHDQRVSSKDTRDFPWKTNSKIVNLFKKMEDLETKYAAKTKSATSVMRERFSDSSLFIYDRESVLVFGGLNPHSGYDDVRNNGKDIYRYIADQNIWEFVGQMPEPRHSHCAAFLKGKIYIVAGADPREEDHKGKAVIVDTVWSFDPLTKFWCKEPSLSYKRKIFGLVVSERYLFAIGGQGAQGRTLSSVERLNVQGGNWEKCSSMLHSRMGVACAKFEEKIWAAGGVSGSKRQPLPDSVECYDIDKNQWTEIGKLRHPRCFGSLFTMSNKLYLIGGAGRIRAKDKKTASISSIDLWNPDLKEWKKVSELTIARHGHAVTYLGTQIFIIGGVTTVYMRGLSNIECFCGSRGSWIRGIAPLPTYLTGHAAITLPPGRLV